MAGPARLQEPLPYGQQVSSGHLSTGAVRGHCGPLARQAADLCRKAGADPEAIPAWIEEGRRCRAAVGQPPFSGGLHRGGARSLGDDSRTQPGMREPPFRALPGGGNLVEGTR